MIRINSPLSPEVVRELRAGDRISLSGKVYTARDAAHRRLVETFLRGEKLPVDLHNQVIYYVGPCPARPGWVIGSAGPTTSTRMDPYTPLLIRQLGLKGMIGKGNRSSEVVEAMKEKGAVYFLAIGGLGALLAERIKKARIVAYEDLGPEAIYELEVEDFPLIVGIDCWGRNAYVEGRALYRMMKA